VYLTVWLKEKKTLLQKYSCSGNVIRRLFADSRMQQLVKVVKFFSSSALSFFCYAAVFRGE